MTLISLVYVSLAAHLMSEDELRELLRVSRDRNKQRNITGMLLYRDGFFIQVLEGKSDDVREVYNKICKDPRHKNIVKVYEQDISKRSFENWSMGFNHLRDLSPDEAEAFTEYLNEPDRTVFSSSQQERAKLLLERFKDRTYF
jgi:hypothetical protein